MTFPEPEEYWRVWPLPSASLTYWPRGVESADDRNLLVDRLETLRDAEALDGIDLDPDWAGFWMLDEAERRAWMGAFFHHVGARSYESLFSEQLFGAFEVPSEFDPRHAVFLRDKQAYEKAERSLINRLMAVGYETAFREDDWRYRDATLAYWAK